MTNRPCDVSQLHMSVWGACISLLTGRISEGEVIAQIWVLLLAGIGTAFALDTWRGHDFPTLTVTCMDGWMGGCVTPVMRSTALHCFTAACASMPSCSCYCMLFLLLPHGAILQSFAMLGFFASSTYTPTTAIIAQVLAIFGSFISYIYSAPPLKLKQSGWAGNYALGSSYIALPWWAGQVRHQGRGKGRYSVGGGGGGRGWCVCGGGGEDRCGRGGRSGNLTCSTTSKHLLDFKCNNMPHNVPHAQPVGRPCSTRSLLVCTHDCRRCSARSRLTSWH